MLAYTPDLPLVETFAATYYIYVLKNPINNEVFYVGKTAKELKVRLSGHLSETAGNTDKAKCVQDILQKGERPIIEAIETIYGISYLDKLKSCEREYFWIKHYKKVYPHLTNKFGTEEGYFHSEYSAYEASVANGETNWYYYYCGKTKYGIKVYDEEKMNEDGFRFPQDKSEMMPTQRLEDRITYVPMDDENPDYIKMSQEEI